MVSSINKFFGKAPAAAAIMVTSLIGGVVSVAGRVFNSYRETLPATDDQSCQLSRLSKEGPQLEILQPLTIHETFGSPAKAAAVVVATIAVAFIAQRVFSSCQKIADDHQRAREQEDARIRGLIAPQIARIATRRTDYQKEMEEMLIKSLRPLDDTERQQVVSEVSRFGFTQGEALAAAVGHLAKIHPMRRTEAVTKALSKETVQKQMVTLETYASVYGR